MKIFKQHTNNTNDSDKLKADVESAFGHQLKTPKDFEQLREQIYDKLNIIIGLSTLMRLWNYVEGCVKPRKSTLDVLAQYLDYKSYEDYSHIVLDDESVSDLILSHGITVSEQLSEGDHLRLTWLPDRVCDIEYLGNFFFRIIAVEKTHLSVGDTFRCEFIVEGEPLYLDQLTHDGMSSMRYVCGKKGGVKFELLPHSDQ